MNKIVYSFIVVMIFLLCGCSKTSIEETTVKYIQTNTEHSNVDGIEEAVESYDISKKDWYQENCDDETTGNVTDLEYIEMNTSDNVGETTAESLVVSKNSDTYFADEEILYTEETTTSEYETIKPNEIEICTTEPVTSGNKNPESITTEMSATEMSTTKIDITETDNTETTTVLEIPEEETTVIEIVAYNPDKVCELATNICQQAGLKSTADSMNDSLANGLISQEEYDMFYPYAGAGYIGVFMETDLSIACTITGNKFSSEQEIAEYLAEIVMKEAADGMFYIECAGVYIHHGVPMYEFRCYRLVQQIFANRRKNISPIVGKHL